MDRIGSLQGAAGMVWLPWRGGSRPEDLGSQLVQEYVGGTGMRQRFSRFSALHAESAPRQLSLPVPRHRLALHLFFLAFILHTRVEGL